jgi:hypothetical protein
VICSAVQCSAVQCSAVQCSAVQCSCPWLPPNAPRSNPAAAEERMDDAMLHVPAEGRGGLQGSRGEWAAGLPGAAGAFVLVRRGGGGLALGVAGSSRGRMWVGGGGGVAGWGGGAALVPPRRRQQAPRAASSGRPAGGEGFRRREGCLTAALTPVSPQHEYSNRVFRAGGLFYIALHCSTIYCTAHWLRARKTRSVRPWGCKDDIWSEEMARNQYLNKRTLTSPSTSVHCTALHCTALHCTADL